MVNNKILSIISELIFPSFCTVCNKNRGLLCAQCKKSLNRGLPECYVCRKLSPNSITHTGCINESKILSAQVFWRYNNTAKKLLKVYKYSKVKDIVKIITTLLSENLSNFAYPPTELETMLTQVPLHKSKENQRGFNQLTEICLELSGKLGYRFIPDLLIRQKSTSKQSGLSNIERGINIKDAFTFNSKYHEFSAIGLRVIIVDDVMTSGATLEESAKAILKQIPQAEIHTFSLFRGTQVRKRVQN